MSALIKKPIESNWYNNHENLVELATYLNTKGDLSSADDMLYFFEKPWKWELEWNEYQNIQKEEMFKVLKI